ncbi:MAG TPA: hypothetical protein PLK35_03260 [Candidatus Moranbacteria bacterium]|nr:hypothetical protein [Candidatus Moranbacteria bacterium]
MSKKAIILTVLSVLLLVLAIFGLQKAKINSLSTNTSIPSVVKMPKEALAKPTGNVGDTVDAIINESTEEKSLLLAEDEVAKNAVSDKQEADDLSKSYDENEF